MQRSTLTWHQGGTGVEQGLPGPLVRAKALQARVVRLRPNLFVTQIIRMDAQRLLHCQHGQQLYQVVLQAPRQAESEGPMRPACSQPRLASKQAAPTAPPNHQHATTHSRALPGSRREQCQTCQSSRPALGCQSPPARRAAGGQRRLQVQFQARKQCVLRGTPTLNVICTLEMQLRFQIGDKNMLAKRCTGGALRARVTPTKQSGGPSRDSHSRGSHLVCAQNSRQQHSP
jgi:hypothetical protein